MSFELFECFDNLLYAVSSSRAVHPADIVGRNGVEFQDIVVYLQQGCIHFGAHGQCGITEHTYLGIGAIAVAQFDCIGNNSCKIGVRCGFTITGKGKYIGQLGCSNHLLQLFFECLCHFCTCGAFLTGAMVLVKAAFAIHTVKGTHFTIGRHQIDT